MSLFSNTMSPAKGKIIIFGATGKTGLCCLQAALELGYSVTAFVRDPTLLPPELTNSVEIITGDVTNPHQVDDAVYGHDEVVIALGTRNDLSPTTVLSDGTSNIISAMQRAGVRKVSACLSAFLLMDLNRVPERFHSITEEHGRMLEALKSSHLDWVAVMPPHISDNPGCKDYTVTHGKAPGRIISKYDLGHFLISALSDESHCCQICGLCDTMQEGAGGPSKCTLQQ